MLDRLAGRRVCENCQRVYHVNMPPTYDWTCDTCGGHVVQRDDDTEEAIDRRLELYDSETVPIIDYYRDQGLLVVIDGVGEGDEVFDRLVKVDRRTHDLRRPTVEDVEQWFSARRRHRSHTCARPGRSWPRCTRSVSGPRSPVPRLPISIERRARCSIGVDARSNFLGYHGFPAVACISPNEVIVHGIPGDRRLDDGDIVSIDCGAIIEGWHADAAITVAVGEIDDESQRLIEVTPASLEAAIGAGPVRATASATSARPARTWSRRSGFSVVREYVGHGIGTAMHEEPDVPNFGPPGRGLRIKDGLVLAIEPMVNAGGARARGCSTTAGRS